MQGNISQTCMEHVCNRNLSSCSQWCLEAVKKAVQIFQHVRPNLCTLQPAEPILMLFWSYIGYFVSVVVLLMLMVFVFSVESLQQGS